MLFGWINYFRQLFTRKTDFVSVDARRFSNSPRNYEMITSAPPRTADSTIKAPEPVVTSPPPKAEYEGLSPLAQSPRSRSSQYTNSVDYFGKDFGEYTNSTFGMDAEYKSPKLSFSTPRPPSAGRRFSNQSTGTTQQTFLPRIDFSQMERIDPPAHSIPVQTVRRGNPERSFSPRRDWDPQSTHAQSFTPQHPYRS